MVSEFRIGERSVGIRYEPLVVAEIGINHEGHVDKAMHMVDEAYAAGCECVKFQCHVVDDEMIPNDVVPANARESIWDIMSRCALTEEEDQDRRDGDRDRPHRQVPAPVAAHQRHDDGQRQRDR